MIERNINALFNTEDNMFEIDVEIKKKNSKAICPGCISNIMYLGKADIFKICLRSI